MHLNCATSSNHYWSSYSIPQKLLYILLLFVEGIVLSRKVPEFCCSLCVYTKWSVSEMMGKERKGGQRRIRWEGDEREYDVRIKDFYVNVLNLSLCGVTFCCSHMHTQIHTCSAVRSLWACANISYPPMNFLTCVNTWVYACSAIFHFMCTNIHVCTYTYTHTQVHKYTHLSWFKKRWVVECMKLPMTAVIPQPLSSWGTWRHKHAHTVSERERKLR